ncbi:hypothetical protein [Methylovorus glucosotrophus]|uniref:Uncharacterized protein n=1 Tax=Methylovorus glucosotrophus (strain SIP3-4) TaxID=582744 RepID=C6X7V3_METGS|nr:hypothetical protein [Methylovorus glucosotrophus]ACT51280.1 hypothetical protein Msip34_2038 [Methylovorus glucosotrophus SIP3-4]
MYGILYILGGVIAVLMVIFGSASNEFKKDYSSNKSTSEVMIAVDQKNRDGLTFLEKASCHNKYSHQASNNSNEEIYARCLDEITKEMMLTPAEAKYKNGLSFTEALECDKQNKNSKQCLADAIQKLKDEENQ